MLVENPSADYSDNGARVYPIQFASRFKRWCVALIDNLMCYGFMFMGIMIFNLLGITDIGHIIGLVLYVILQLYVMKTYGQTLGKRWLNIRVLDYMTNRPLSFGRYVIREFLDFGLNTSGLVIINAIVAFVNQERRSFTDIIMSTIVVKN